MREISLTDTKISGNVFTKNPSVAVYDTSGAYTDPNIEIDVRKGLPKLREEWIIARGDTEQLDAISSEYGQERLNMNL
jgi:phosphomethylpyrimidine synthase